MRKTGVILAVLFCLVAGGYLFTRFYLLRSPDFTPDTSKARSALDLRPALIAKLQQVVKDGSKGLYLLTIDSISPNIAAGSVELVNAQLRVDSSVLASLDSAKQAPDDIYGVRIHRLVVSGIGLGELLNQKNIDLRHILVYDPEVTLSRIARPYNANKRQQRDSIPLYQRITQHISHIAVDSIRVENGSYINRNMVDRTKDGRMDGLTLNMTGMLIDSTTQNDSSRVFFAENAVVTSGRIERRTADSLYLLRTDSVSLDAKARSITATNLRLIPRGDKAYFRKKLVYRGDRFDISIPRITFRDMHWWTLFNEGTLQCGSATIYGGYLKDFVDGTMPAKTKIRINNFPYQALRQLTLPIHIPKVYFRNFRVEYAELSRQSEKTGTLYFDNINATITNVINIPSHVRPGMWCTIDARTKFMHRIPGKVRMSFDMNRYKNGVYTASLQLGAFSGQLLNPVTENMALFSLKKGDIDSCSIAIKGNNYRTGATVMLLYHDLHITAYKKQDSEEGKQKKKPLINFFMNTFIIENHNPRGKGKPRIAVSDIERGNSPSYFNFTWKAIRFGILSSVGVPETFIPK